jgi:antitoxin component of RelBE/YafQ-DinJ toxin-antitoxin module
VTAARARVQGGGWRCRKKAEQRPTAGRVRRSWSILGASDFLKTAHIAGFRTKRREMKNKLDRGSRKEYLVSMKKRVNLTLDVDLLDEMQKLADKQGISVSNLVNYTMKAGMESTKDVVDALDGLSISELFNLLQREARKKKK